MNGHCHTDDDMFHREGRQPTHLIKAAGYEIICLFTRPQQHKLRDINATTKRRGGCRCRTEGYISRVKQNDPTNTQTESMQRSSTCLISSS